MGASVTSSDSTDIGYCRRCRFKGPEIAMRIYKLEGKCNVQDYGKSHFPQNEEDINELVNDRNCVINKLKEQKALTEKLGKLCKSLHEEKHRDRDGYVQMITNLQNQLSSETEKFLKQVETTDALEKKYKELQEGHNSSQKVVIEKLKIDLAVANKDLQSKLQLIQKLETRNKIFQEDVDTNTLQVYSKETYGHEQRNEEDLTILRSELDLVNKKKAEQLEFIKKLEMQCKKLQDHKENDDNVHKMLINKLQTDLDVVNTKLKQQTKLVSKLEEKCKDIQDERSNEGLVNKSNVEEMRKELSSLNGKLKERTASNKELKTKLKAVKKDLGKQKKKNKQQENTITELSLHREQNMQLSKELEETKTSCENHQAYQKILEQKNRDLHKRLQLSEVRCNSLAGQASRIKELESKLKAQESLYLVAMDDCRNMEFQADDEREHLRQEWAVEYEEQLQHYKDKTLQAEEKSKQSLEKYYIARFEMECLKQQQSPSKLQEGSNGC